MVSTLLTAYYYIARFGEATSGTATIASILDSGVFSETQTTSTDPGEQLDAANNQAQLNATLAGAAASFTKNPFLGVLATGTAVIALQDANGVLINDNLKGAAWNIQVSDAMTVMGDALLVEAGALDSLGLGALPASKMLDAAGTVL